jgi:hypothetical protein
VFLMWYDNDRKKPARAKIDEAVERFVEKYGRQPALVLVHPEEAVDEAALPVATRATVGRHQFWVGEPDEAAASVA